MANAKRIDLTKDDNETSTLTYSISQLTQDLVFLHKEFNKSIRISNTKIDEKNTEFIEKY